MQVVVEYDYTIVSTSAESAFPSFNGTEAIALVPKQPICHSWRWCNSSRVDIRQGFSSAYNSNITLLLYTTIIQII